MADRITLNYDELQAIAKQFSNEAEKYMQLTHITRQKVHDLENDWIGLGASSFFEEFEEELLPAMVRLQQALAFASETLLDIMKAFDQAESETASYFDEGTLEEGGEVDLGTTDFGASEFDSIPDGVTPPGSDQGGAPQADIDPAESAEQPEEELPEPVEETPPAGGGGGSGGEQGLQGDLEMGVGSHSQTGSAAGEGSQSGGGSGSSMADHIYDSSSSSKAGSEGGDSR
jgi:WXG100 family type VII secretion target